MAAVALVAAVLAAGLWLWQRDGGADALAGTEPVTASVLEERFGARIDLVGLLAVGGLVELRFEVVDKDKAAMLFHHGEHAPRLVVPASGKVLRTAQGMAHKLTLKDGASYFIFYANSGSAVHEGSEISVAIGDVRLDHVEVQR